MSLQQLMDKILEIEEGLSITSPVSLSVKKAWDPVPPANTTLVDLPAWTNTWSMDGMDWLPGDMRDETYVVRMILAVGESTTEQDRQGRIATAFWESLLNALHADPQLGGFGRLQRIRSAQQGIVPFGGRSYVGLEVSLEVYVIEAKG